MKKKISDKIGIVLDSKTAQFLCTALLWLLHPLLFIKETDTAIQVYQKHGAAIALPVLVISFFITHFFLKTQKKIIINKLK